MKLKIFSNREFLLNDSTLADILYPFESNSLEKHQYSWLRPYDNYIKCGRSFFDMVSLEEADLVILPFNWADIRGWSWRSKIDKRKRELADRAIQFAQKAEQAGKPLVVFFSGDCSDEEIPIKNAKVFRVGPYRSTKKQNDFVAPAFVEDLVEHYLEGLLPIRQKREKPVVGFCGLAKQDSWKMKLKTIVYQGVMLTKQGRTGIPPYKGEILRTKALGILANNPLVDTNFIIRDRSVFLNNDDLNQKQKMRLEFVQNMAESDYILCCRGSGNCSIRLIETLCCGKIPIFIDTDCVLPYDFGIDWKKYCVWVDEKELPLLAEKVAEFHNNLSPLEFVDLQYECRRLWKEWLSPEGFFTNFYQHFQTRSQNQEHEQTVGTGLPATTKLPAPLVN